MDLSVGDLIEGHGVRRVITEVRATGYSWRYYGQGSDEVYESENSSDPLFVVGWRRVPAQERALLDASGMLPPLPEPDWKEAWAVPGMPVAERWFGQAKMRAYALEAVRAERERIAGLVLHKAELLVLPSDSWAKTYLVELAAAIRAQGSKT